MTRSMKPRVDYNMVVLDGIVELRGGSNIDVSKLAQQSVGIINDVVDGGGLCFTCEFPVDDSG